LCGSLVKCEKKDVWKTKKWRNSCMSVFLNISINKQQGIVSKMVKMIIIIIYRRNVVYKQVNKV